MSPRHGPMEDGIGEIVASLPTMTYRAFSGSDAWCFTSVQGGLVEQLGTRADELCGEPNRWMGMIDRADRARVGAERRRAARGGRLELEYRLRTPDGDDRWVHDVAVRADRDHDVMLGIVTDLTVHRRADQVLEQLHDARLDAVSRLLQAAALRGATVQLFAHDMRSPLTAVVGLAQTLEQRGGRLSDEDRDRIFGRMVDAGNGLLALVDDFSRFWDLPLDDAADPVRPVRLDVVASAAMEEVCLEDGQVSLDVGDVVVDTQPELLRRVIVGLVRNAVKHTPAGTGVRVSASSCEGRIILEVEDDGPGIPDHLRDRVFDGNVRAVGAGEGMGMGLTLVRAAIELLGGDVQALEGPSGGTVVHVEVPQTSTAVRHDPAVG